MIATMQQRMTIEQYELFAFFHSCIIAYAGVICFNVGMSNPELFTLPPDQPRRGGDPHLDEERFDEAVEKRKRRRHLQAVPEPVQEPLRSATPDWKLSDEVKRVGKAGIAKSRQILQEAEQRRKETENPPAPPREPEDPALDPERPF